MSSTTTRSYPWLEIAGAGALVIGLVVLVLGMNASSSAAQDREDAELRVSHQESAVAEAEADLGAAQAALQDARVEAEDAVAERDATEQDLTDVEAALADSEAALAILQADIPSFVQATAGAVAEAAELAPALADLAARQRNQLEAILAEDYAAYNALRADYGEPAGEVAEMVDDLAALVEGLPSVAMADPHEYAGAALEGVAPAEPDELDPPTGPAVIAAILPEQIDCAPWGNEGCHYAWTIRFEESNWLAVEITRIGVRYRKGNRYCTWEAGEYVDVSIDIGPNGSDTWGDSIYLDRDGPCWREIGGELLVRWEGVDADGNRLSGRATSPLENPS